MTKYLDWDYDQKVVITYEREGECNGCGDCCTAGIAYTSPPSKRGTQLLEWTEQPDTGGKGIWAEAYDVTKPRMLTKLFDARMPMAHVCPEFDLETHHCALQACKPRICSEFPVTPREIATFANCSYKFTEVSRRPFDEPIS